MTSSSRSRSSRSSRDQMSYRDLDQSDIIKLTGILSHAPPPYLHSSSLQVVNYRKVTKKQLERLPRHLEHPDYYTFRGRFKYAYHVARGDRGVLCELHAPLNYYVARSILHFVRREVEDTIPAFVKSLDRAGVLTKEQSSVFSIFDALPSMWRSNFTASFSAMRGDGLAMSKWQRQEDHCYACMLARLGGDEKVVFALAAGILGRHRGKGIYIARSRRLMWIESWLSGFADKSEKMMDDSWALGKQLRALATQVRLGKSAARKVRDVQPEAANSPTRPKIAYSKQNSTATTSTGCTLVDDEPKPVTKEPKPVTEEVNPFADNDSASIYSQSEGDEEEYDDEIIESYKHRTIYSVAASSPTIPTSPHASGPARIFATSAANKAANSSPPSTHRSSHRSEECRDSAAPLLQPSMHMDSPLRSGEKQTFSESNLRKEPPKPRRKGAQTQAFEYIEEMSHNPYSTDPYGTGFARPKRDPFADPLTRQVSVQSVASDGTLVVDGPDENGQYTTKRIRRDDDVPKIPKEEREEAGRWRQFRSALRDDDDGSVVVDGQMRMVGTRREGSGGILQARRGVGKGISRRWKLRQGEEYAETAEELDVTA